MARIMLCLVAALALLAGSQAEDIYLNLDAPSFSEGIVSSAAGDASTGVTAQSIVYCEDSAGGFCASSRGGSPGAPSCCVPIDNPPQGAGIANQCCVAGQGPNGAAGCVAYGYPGEYSICLGGSNGDPVIAGFDGSTFNFVGEVGQYYNILSETNHQITGMMTPAIMWDHNGTYFGSVGFKYQEHKVSVSVNADGSLEVLVNGRALVMNEDTWTMTEELIPASGKAEDRMSVKWQFYRQGYGHAVEISTPMMTFLIWSAPPGPDAGGFKQKAYLNFQTTLLAAPGGPMSGVLGQTYAKLVRKSDGGAGFQHTAEAELQVSDIFADDFKYNRFGLKQAAANRRALAEDNTAIGAWPLTAFVRN